VTDGDAQEINGVVTNIGTGRAFPNAVHSLCYFHLAIIGWSKHVTLPSLNDCTATSDTAIDMIRDWIKTWFFELESEDEYRHSVGELLQFLDMTQENGVLPPHTIESIKVWIIKHLQKSESLWVNYLRLFVPTMNMRTTSIAEALHWSMKSGYDGVCSGNKTEVSASKMMDKAARKAKEIAIHNAGQIIRKQKWTQMSTANHLTDYCQAMADIQWELAQHCVVVHASRSEWYVYRPDNSGSQRCFPPRYLRLRKVCVVDDTYAWCTCGLPHRTKYPCQHLYAVTGEAHPQMFAQHWTAAFQHFYQRPEAESLTEKMDHLQGITPGEKR
jgi:hypothetical protein